MANPFSFLPNHLLQFVLAFLPPLDLSRLRSVCKSWHSATSSPEFLHLYKRLHPSHDSWLVLYCHQEKVLTWASSQSRWLSLDFPSFWVREWAAAGGLLCLCCILSEITKKGYFVGNPLMRAWKQLPDPPETNYFGRIWSLSTCAASESYWVIVLNSASASMQIFDSKTGDWSLKMLPQLVVGSHAPVDPVLAGNSTGIGDLVYSIHGASRSIFTFDVKRDLWKRLDAAVPEALAIQIRQEGYLIEMVPKVVEGMRGNISLIGGLSGENQGLESMAVVWELDISDMVWREVARAPSEMWKSMLEEAKESREPPLLPVKFIAGKGDVIFIMALGCCRAMKYSLSYGNWEWLELPSTSNCALGLSFQPSIVARI